MLATIVSLVLVVVLFCLFNFQSVDESYNKSCVTAHNAYREKHGSPPLAGSTEAVRYAKARSEACAALGRIEHRKDGNNGYGENLYFQYPQPATCETVIKAFYDEFAEFNYDYNSPEPDHRAFHATQVVWRDTKYVGCYQTKARDNYYVACEYMPPGNYLGRFQENVKPPK